MTTFTSDDREEAYKGYEDAVPIPFAGWVNTAPPHIVDSGASVMGMSALELANLLDFDAKTLNWKSFADAATMLRQQQAEISLLQEYVYQLEEGLNSSINLNKAQAERNNET